MNSYRAVWCSELKESVALVGLGTYQGRRDFVGRSEGGLPGSEIAASKTACLWVASAAGQERRGLLKLSEAMLVWPKHWVQI